jgi:putative ABC transport system permease protein
MSVGTWWRRLTALGRTRRLDEDLDREIAAHLALAEEDAAAAGLSGETARREARLHFGPVERMRAEHRDARGVRWLSQSLADARHALRVLARDRAMATTAVGVLALGIGASAAMFSAVDAVLWKPLPFERPDRIVQIWQAPRPGSSNATSPLDFLDWQRMGTSFSALAAERDRAVTLSGAAAPVRLAAREVTADYFAVFTAPTVLGRVLVAGETDRADARVVVLSHATWQRQFGADPGVLGRTLLLDDVAHVVAGVLAPGAFDRQGIDLWLPLVFTPEQQVRDYHSLLVSGRLRDGVSLDQARAQMSAVDAGVAASVGGRQQWRLMVEPLDRLLAGDAMRQSMVAGFAAAACVLLIACANVATLLLARGAARRKDLAVRAALGASRGRLAAQLLTESFVLALLGGIAGVLVAYGLLLAGAPTMVAALPYTAVIQMDGRVLAYVGATVLLVTLVVGTLPALQTRPTQLAPSLKASGRGSSGRSARVRRTLVAGEIALSLVLTCAAGLLVRSMLNLQHVDTGVRLDDVAAVKVDLPIQRYRSPERAAQFYAALTERLDAAPGISHAGLTTALPLYWISNGEALFVPGIAEPVRVRLKRIDHGYLDTFDIPVVAGRGIDERDRDGAAAVIVINQTLAARLRDATRGADPIGLTLDLSTGNYTGDGGRRVTVQIVGVIRNERVTRPGRDAPPVVYAPLAQLPAASVHLVLRSPEPLSATVDAMRRALHDLDPGLPLGTAMTMADAQAQTLEGSTRPAYTIGALAVLALGLAAFGLYGVVAHAMALQRREIGIRLALGASSSSVVTMALRSTAATVAGGAITGLAAAVAFARSVRHLLYGITPLDPLSLAGGCVVLVLVALVAGTWPAMRAARLSPSMVLRDE